jgi:hypothetical protein
MRLRLINIVENCTLAANKAALSVRSDALKLTMSEIDLGDGAEALISATEVQYRLRTQQRLAGFAADSTCKSRISTKRLQVMKAPPRRSNGLIT